MTSSKKWANIVSSTASCIYFLVIILQIPLFRVPCRAGICTSPMEVTSSQLIAFELLPLVIVKGAVANAFVKNKTIPSYDNLSLYEFTNVKATTAISDLQRLEVLAGSYLSVAGALVGLIKPGRMSLFGILLILWGLVREIILRRSMSTDHIYIYPAMSIAMFSAFLSVTKDVRRIIRSFRGP